MRQLNYISHFLNGLSQSAIFIKRLFIQLKIALTWILGQHLITITSYVVHTIKNIGCVTIYSHNRGNTCDATQVIDVDYNFFPAYLRKVKTAYKNCSGLPTWGFIHNSRMTDVSNTNMVLCYSPSVRWGEEKLTFLTRPDHLLVFFF